MFSSFSSELFDDSYQFVLIFHNLNIKIQIINKKHILNGLVGFKGFNIGCWTCIDRFATPYRRFFCPFGLFFSAIEPAMPSSGSNPIPVDYIRLHYRWCFYPHSTRIWSNHYQRLYEYLAGSWKAYHMHLSQRPQFPKLLGTYIELFQIVSELGIDSLIGLLQWLQTLSDIGTIVLEIPHLRTCLVHIKEFCKLYI